MTTQTGSTPATAAEPKAFGQVGYDAYGNHPSAHGPWTTFDGRPMPKWGELTLVGGVLTLTQERWEAAAQAIIEDYELRLAEVEAAKPKGLVRRLLDWLLPNGELSLSLTTTKRTIVHSEPLDYSAVVERLAGHEYTTSPRGPQGGLRVDVRHGEDPGRWVEVAESVLETLNKGGADAVAMALHLMMGGPRGGKAEHLLEQAEQREAAPARQGLSRGTTTLRLDTSGLDERLAAFKAEVEEVVAGSDGRIDPFIMGISELASAARDLAEASRACGGANDDAVAELIEDVTKALHHRVRALASPPSDT